MAPLRVLLVGDDPLARSGLAFLLAADPGLVVVAATAPENVAAALAGTDAGDAGDAGGAGAPSDIGGLADPADPDVAVWDTGTDPADWLERLGGAGAPGDPSDGRPPALALLEREEGAAEALAAGARGLVFRDVEAPRLAAALRALAAGLLVFDEALAEAASPLRLLAPASAESAGPPPAPAVLPEPLTPRETEVLQLLAQGLSNRLIAERLGISERTAKFHVNSIVTKLGARTRTEAAMQAARLGLVLL